MLKLSELKGEKAFDVLADLSAPIMHIAADKEAAEMFGVKALPKGMTVAAYALQRLRESLPVLLSGHKRDLVMILAILSEQSYDDYAAEMTIPKIINDFSAIVSDPLFNAFFTTQQSIETSSTSALENTAE